MQLNVVKRSGHHMRRHTSCTIAISIQAQFLHKDHYTGCPRARASLYVYVNEVDIYNTLC